MSTFYASNGGPFNTDLVSRDQRARKRPIRQHGLTSIPVGRNIGVDDGERKHRPHSDTQPCRINEGKCEEKRGLHISKQVEAVGCSI